MEISQPEYQVLAEYESQGVMPLLVTLVISHHGKSKTDHGTESRNNDKHETATHEAHPEILARKLISKPLKRPSSPATLEPKVAQESPRPQP